MADQRSRVDDLLAKMTTAEKAGQLTQYVGGDSTAELATTFVVG